MQYIFSLLPLLACPLGMGLMMWLLMRGNKDQATREVDQAPANAYRESVEVANGTPQGASLLKTISSCLKMCLNWKVLAGLAVVGVIVWVVAPRLALAALPLLLVAACPLSMLFMMRGMSKSGSQGASQASPSPAVGLTHDEQLVELRSRLLSVQGEQEAIAGQIAEIESPETPVMSEAQAVARGADERSRTRTLHRRR